MIADENLSQQFADAISRAKHINDYEGESYNKMKATENSITSTVGYLRSLFPNKHINEICSQLWDLLESKKLQSALAPGLRQVVFSLMVGKSGSRAGVILIPDNFYELYQKDAVYMTGAFVFCASQAKDFCLSGKEFSSKEEAEEFSKEVLARSQSYEAEYLLTIQRITPNWKPNDYQTFLMKKYPEGINTK